MDDAELIRDCIGGDPQAWRILARRHVPLMAALARRALPEGSAQEVEDVVQAVFLKLWADGRRRLRGFRGSCRLSTWLGAVARREALDRLRKQDRFARAAEASRRRAGLRLERELGAADDPAGAARLERIDRAERLEEAVSRLPPRDRLLVRLVYQDECTYAEAARMLQAAENSIGPWLQRARERLRSLLLAAPSD